MKKLTLTDVSGLIYETRKGRVLIDDERLQLVISNRDRHRYSNAQLDDYHVDGRMRWRSPLQMTVRARFSHQEAGLLGTAGFGFWNDPFAMTKIENHRSWLPHIRLPQAVWFFFAAPPSDMALALDVAGFGWKAATIDASSVLAASLLPFAPLGMLACRWSWAYRLLWPLAQRVLKIDEAVLPMAMDEWHDYRLMWNTSDVCFFVDGQEQFRTRYSPRGPLGFVAWVDNQYMVATPQGRIRHGAIAIGEQWMEIASLEVVAD